MPAHPRRGHRRALGEGARWPAVRPTTVPATRARHRAGRARDRHDAPGGKPAHPAAVAQLPGAAALRRRSRRPGLRRGLLLPPAGHQPAEMDLHGPAQGDRLPRSADLVACAGPRARRCPGGRNHPLPARQGWPVPGGRVQGARGPDRLAAARCRDRRAPDPRLRRRPRPGGSPDRHRRGSWRLGDPAGPPRRRAPGGRGGRRGRQLRGDQHAARLAAARGVPADGGIRAGRRDRHPGARSRAAGVRGRRPVLRRAGR